MDFLERLRLWLEAEDIFVAGQIVWRARGGYGLMSRCLLVNLKDYKRFGYPAFGDGLSADPEQCDTFFGSVPGDAGGIPACELQGGRLVAAGFAHNATVRGFPPELAGFLVDFGSDLTRQSGVLDAIARQAEQARSGVFVLNFEGYEDIEVPPPGFRPPVSVLYSVAAGLKPNRILATHGFAADTRVVYFDYSEQALNFRRLMVQRWDGRDLPRFLGENMRCAPADGAHYFLWPGASASDPDWAEMDRLWRLELDRCGGGCLRHRVYELPQWDRERSHQE